MSVKRYVGVCRAKAVHVYFSASPSKAFGFMSIEGREYDTPEEINQDIKSLRAHNEKRHSYAVIEGSLQFLQRYRSQLTEPDYVIFVSDEKTLNQLGVPIMDKESTGHTLDELFYE